MKKYTTATVTGIAALALGMGSAVRANANEEEREQTIKLSDVPEAVQKTLKEQAVGADFIKVEKESERGKTVYEGVIQKRGKQIGIEVSADGKYLGTHDEEKEHREKGEKD